MDLRDVIEDVALGDEDIAIAIVVEIFERDAPPGVTRGECGQASRVTRIAKLPGAFIAIEGVFLKRQIGDQDIGTPIVVIVCEGDTHAGKRLAIVGERDTRLHRHLLELRSLLVVKEKLFHTVVRDEDVGKAIAVVVVEGHAEGFAFGRGDAGGATYIGESAMALIVEE